MTLTAGGKLIVQTSSILHIAQKLIDNPKFADQYGWSICLFGNQKHPGDYHYTGFTDVSLTVHIAAAGFKIVEKSLIQEWMFNYECIKTDDWSDIAFEKLNDRDFLQASYQRFFKRDLDEQGFIHFGGQLRRGVSRVDVLHELVSAPERLYVVSRELNL